MATTTPNYGWDVPTSTDYVKDGATAIETLGDDIDATLFSITSGRNVGLVSTLSTSFSSAATVNINNCFSSSFENYKMIICVTDSSSTGGNIAWQSRNAGTTDTTSNSYSVSGVSHLGGSVTALNNGNQNTGFIGYAPLSSGWGQISADIILPFANEYTTIFYQNSGVSGGADGYAAAATLRRTASSHDGITIIFPANSTGTIRIYGYRNAT